MGRTVTVEWNGRKARAIVPDTLAHSAPVLSEGTVRRTERAAAAVRRVGDLTSRGLEVAARLLLRAEGVASSYIEGVQARPDEVAVAGLDDSIGGSAGWVADNLAALDEALSEHGPLDAETLWRWHRRLMRHSDLEPEHIGRWRDRQGWVGGATPLTAAYVAPPASEIGRLMEDLVAFANLDVIDPVTHAAIVHAQFETIHPFADGNGRVGRLLIGRLLRDRLNVAVPPAVSVQFARDIGGYLSGLVLFREVTSTPGWDGSPTPSTTPPNAPSSFSPPWRSSSPAGPTRHRTCGGMPPPAGSSSGWPNIPCSGPGKYWRALIPDAERHLIETNWAVQHGRHVVETTCWTWPLAIYRSSVRRMSLVRRTR